MSKIKPLLPSLRERKRYVVYEVISKKKTKESQAADAILQACQSFFGDMGMAQAGILMLHDKYNEEHQQGILRVNNKMVDHVKGALCFVKEIDGEEVIVRSKGVSGILKKAQSKFMAS